jgi:hypothetical protein
MQVHIVYGYFVSRSMVSEKAESDNSNGLISGRKSGKKYQPLEIKRNPDEAV